MHGFQIFLYHYKRISFNSNFLHEFLKYSVHAFVSVHSLYGNEQRLFTILIPNFSVRCCLYVLTGFQGIHRQGEGKKMR